MKIFGIVVAGGTGTRMGNTEKPKQFLPIGGKPILVHTMEKFCACRSFEEVIVLCPEAWISYTDELLREYLPEEARYAVLAGGRLRNDTIMNGIAYIREHYGLEEDTYLVTHDAVRPLVTLRILQENIACAETGIACTTAIPATDTIVESMDGEQISGILNRDILYQCQTPQSFRAKAFLRIYQGLTAEEKEVSTDASKVFRLKGEKVALIRGEQFNIKITYPYDLQIAETMLKK